MRNKIEELRDRVSIQCNAMITVIVPDISESITLFQNDTRLYVLRCIRLDPVGA